MLLFENLHLKGLISITLLLNKPHDVPKVLTTHLWEADKIRQSVCQLHIGKRSAVQQKPDILLSLHSFMGVEKLCDFPAVLPHVWRMGRNVSGAKLRFYDGNVFNCRFYLLNLLMPSDMLS